MTLESITLEGAIKAATPVAKKLFKSKVAPLISTKIGEYFKSKAAIKKFENQTTKYVAQLVGKCSTLNTIAFQNSPKKIEELYIPLTIIDGSEKNRITVKENTDVFEENNHILITDSAGMGKSTLSKRVILNAVGQGWYVPVFVELRELDNRAIEVQIAERFGFTSDTPTQFLRKLPLLYVFDGLDEVSTDIQKDVVDSINQFSNIFTESRILLTSRKETYLSQFVGFKRYSICSLEEDEAYALINKCDPTGKISKKLISGIQSSSDAGLKEFLSTPLYVSLLFCSYRYKTVIPQKKHLFYSQVYDALFESHDLSKDVGYVRPKYSNLDSAEFHCVLRRLGFWCLKNNGKIEFQKDELEIVLQRIVDSISGIDVSASSYSKDLISTVPLFVKEGATIRWSHKSLMEYFASMFICSDAKLKQQELLLHFYNSNKLSSYHNVFELCADIDYGTFRVSILKTVLESFIDYSKCNYEEIVNKRISDHKINERISLTFSLKVGFKFFEDIEKIDLFHGKWSSILENESKGDSYDTSFGIYGFVEDIYVGVSSRTGRERMILKII